MKISIRQILASTAGAVVAATIASFFGVSGTIVGVAIGSAAATIGTALVAQSIDRTHHAVRQAVVRSPNDSLLRRLGGTDATGAVAESAPSVDVAVNAAPTVSQAAPPPDATVPIEVPPAPEETSTAPVAATSEESLPETTVAQVTTPGPQTVVLAAPAIEQGGTKTINWRVVAVTSVIVFILVLAIITFVELAAGKPLADLFGGSPGSGTSIFGGTTNTTSPTAPTTTTVPPSHQTSTTTGSSTTTTGDSTTTTSTSVPTTTTTSPTISTTTSAAAARGSSVPPG